MAAARHRSTAADQHPLIRAGVDRFLTWLAATLASTNAIGAAALLLAEPGNSPAMLFLLALAPLQIWAVLPALVTALIVAGALGQPTRAAAHVVGMFLWGFIAVGAVTGLVTSTSPSPSASLLLTALLLAVASWHAGALLFRRREARLR